MHEEFNVAEYLGFLLRRWRLWAIACVTAGLLALGFSLLQPKQYTATASILIDAPSVGDPRVATAISPMYLESLRTYEHFVESDTVFLDALEKFHLRAEYPGAAVDSLRRRILKVTKLRDTRILEISVTLRDPVRAQALTQYIAEQTVNLNRTLNRQSDQDFINEAQRQLDYARGNLEQAENAFRTESARGPYEALQAEVDNLVELRSRLQRDMLEAKVDIEDYTAQGKQRELQSVRMRAAALEKQVADVDAELGAKEKTAARRRADLGKLDADMKAARATYQTAENRMNEIRQTAGGRSERLRIIDPGIVPQRPSSPNIPLNVMAALVIATVFAWLYLTVAFALRGQTRSAPVRVYSSER
jgi:uncharacterized protein involved in exopolysaccharide biosynthesis